MKKNYIFLCFISLFLISSCGHKTFPSPSDESELFSWHNVNASIVNNTLFISGQVLGNKDNLASINVEVQALDEDCAACPFVNEFSEEFFAKNILDIKNGVFTINYPLLNRNAEAYRWRLVGKNYIFGIDETVSPVYITNK